MKTDYPAESADTRNSSRRNELVLGIEGTAWNLSIGIVSPEEVISSAESPYVPKSGGIHPREAAQHHADVLPGVLREALKKMRERGYSEKDIRGVAFSIGPGLGPCLRIVATSARALSIKWGVPLIGVNHCIAHVEIGRWMSDAEDPIVLYLSGANSQVIGYMAGRYRILGETLDIGLGNALDKFARAVGLRHPGGPEIERLAERSSRYLPLPYTVKGMDFAFSGILSAAKRLAEKHPLEDVCYSLQETVFAMCTEVAERALALSEKNELLLVGGVGMNRRLQRMLRDMCEDRGASFHMPPPEYMKDNGVMIAYTGLLMLKSGCTIEIEESRVRPDYRPDEVEVKWR
ncbi:MAG: bifunctional N6-L-threonylcarbamoyladenine synthase / protein kinase Bud32 [Archaeoglobi archaeon]|nr:bifunctional N6-L-threonylcarbamoyladenine synthase / protein kinase Bud32 [Archaeoglobi archaeon]